jgi:hypothetical protein
MSTSATAMQQLAAKARTIKSAIANLGDMIPGSLVERFRKCGKPNCHCAQKDERGHGPTLVITREVQGRTITKTVPDSAVQDVRAATEEYKHFRELVRDLVETSEQLGDLRLQQAAKDHAAKKNRARRQLRR